MTIFSALPHVGSRTLTVTETKGSIPSAQTENNKAGQMKVTSRKQSKRRIWKTLQIGGNWKEKHPNISYIKLREFWLSSHLPHCFNLVQDRICTARVKWSRVKDSDHFCSSPQPRGINILNSAVSIRSKFGGTTTRHWIIWITKTGSGGECLRVSQAVNKRKLSVTHASGQSHKSTPNS